MDGFPWASAAASWFIAPLVGFYLGRLSERHKEYVMNVRESVRAWFDRWYRVLYSVVAIVAVCGVLLGGSASWQNSKDLVTSCENANESRQAARALWGYIIDLSEARNTDATRSERRAVANFRDYVDAVYAPRDCTDLSRKYELPDPPPVVEPKSR